MASDPALVDRDADAATIDFGFTGAIETSMITAAGTYEIRVGGARGGDTPTFGNSGGIGAIVGGEIFIDAGAVIEVLVGGAGGSGAGNGGGGGGLSFFGFQGETPLAIAAVAVAAARVLSLTAGMARVLRAAATALD